ncbi:MULTISPECIES: DUF3397 domain-containing protein [Cytobacillus]|uniref:DUF3397 domain-containing protein n=1 Tax=Cytobacillus stercorigallinarum TaxID=2762240 RepID=A0ABR8QMR8_9BACI|nr:DUF3397 domain-containing protein [Cytobacillus stercorigallinarum]MBD7936825.1 DUF3397 domain-containing protein [Cytobacillus stercorigallinarum]
MSVFLSSMIATFITIPFLGYLLVFIICKQVTKKHKKSVHLALDITTLLLILSVHFMIASIWNRSYIWLIFLFLITTAILYLLYYWRVKQEIDYSKLFKGYWRINFLFFLTAYGVLIVIGIFNSISYLVF